jgi:hypothetical protein
MPVMTDYNRSIAANVTVDNIVAGKLDEFLRIDSIVSVYAVAQAVGVRMTVLIGAEAAIDDQELVARAAATAVIIPDDFVVNSAGFNGDRLIIRLRNTTAGAIIVNTRVETTPA